MTILFQSSASFSDSTINNQKLYIQFVIKSQTIFPSKSVKDLRQSSSFSLVQPPCVNPLLRE